MKALCLAALLLALSQCLNASTAQMDGNDLLEKCAFTLQLPDNGGARFEAAYCLGYVLGVIDDDTLWFAVEKKKGTNDSSRFCIPEGVTNGQELKVLKKWLDNNPDKLHLRADVIIHNAMVEAFPCK